MHEFKACMKGIGACFSSYLKDLKLDTFSDIYLDHKTHINFCSGKFIFTKIVLFILHYKYPNNLYLSKYSEIESSFKTDV
jgi:hypothetical protein